MGNCTHHTPKTEKADKQPREVVARCFFSPLPFFSFADIGTLLPTDGRGAVRVSRGAGRLSVRRRAAPRTLTVGLPLRHSQLVFTSLNVAVVSELQEKEKRALILKADRTCRERRMHSTSYVISPSVQLGGWGVERGFKK